MHMRLRTVVIIGIALAASAGAQTFEAASIKVSKDVDPGSSILQDQSGNLTVHNAPLKRLIVFAFGVREHQVIGTTGWMDSERFDIIAKPETRATSGLEFRKMIQALLADRFQLKVREETREMPIYSLTVAKGGPKLTEWKDTVGPSCSGMAGQLTCHKITMVNLCDELARKLGRTVADKTGVAGNYDLALKWVPDVFEVPSPSDAGRTVVSDAPGGPSLFNAVEEQLGLKLLADKGPVPVVVVEAAVRPSEN
jgi:uncharacterized protein (TIGR03435 family)